jgi:hypothetical protein
VVSSCLSLVQVSLELDLFLALDPLETERVVWGGQTLELEGAAVLIVKR